MKITRKAKRAANRLFRLCVVNGLLDEARVREVVNRLVTGGHRDGVAILGHFHRLVRLECARHTALIESATTLPTDLKVAVQAGLANRYGAGLTTAFVLRPELIGGMRVQVGNDVYDGSVRAGLAALESSF
jgi:F-type H+-transporting ATPase subunit delta